MRITLSLALLLSIAACGDDDHDDHDDHDQGADAGAIDGGAAAADAGAVMPDAAGVVRTETNAFSFGRGEFIEARVQMAAGDGVRVMLTPTGGEVFFNIHAHVDGLTTTFIEDEADAVDHAFEAPSDGLYWLLIGNRSVQGTIEVAAELELRGDAELVDWGD